MKRIISLIVAALLLCAMGGAVYAQSITGSIVADETTVQYESTQMFLAYLDQMDVNYNYGGIDGSGYETVTVPNTDSDLGKVGS